MLRRFATRAAVALIAGWIATGANAASYTMSWSGIGGFSMTGSFSFSDALLGSTHVTEADLTAFEIQTFLNGGALNSWDYFNDGLSAGASMMGFRTERFNGVKRRFTMKALSASRK